MKEIGGYIEFGGLIEHPYHKEAFSFNSFRNALRYFIRKKQIKKIYLPYYLCDVVYDACTKENCEVVLYHIDKNFFPILEPSELDGYLYIVNYYGILSNHQIEKLKQQYQSIIIDNTHSFFQKPVQDVCTIYGCRKYFGVPDGAYMYSNIENNDELKSASALNHIDHLIGRLEENANQYYEEFSRNDEYFNKAEVSKMSKFSSLLMGAIDYEESEQRRKENYHYLHEKLKKYQRLNVPDYLTFMYPFYIENGQKLRNYLISKKIYIPKLWPNIVEKEMLNQTEKQYIENILPLPIDQRYTKKEMDLIVSLIENYYEGENEDDKK